MQNYKKRYEIVCTNVTRSRHVCYIETANRTFFYNKLTDVKISVVNSG